MSRLLSACGLRACLSQTQAVLCYGRMPGVRSAVPPLARKYRRPTAACQHLEAEAGNGRSGETARPGRGTESGRPKSSASRKGSLGHGAVGYTPAAAYHSGEESSLCPEPARPSRRAKPSRNVTAAFTPWVAQYATSALARHSSLQRLGVQLLGSLGGGTVPPQIRQRPGKLVSSSTAWPASRVSPVRILCSVGSSRGLTSLQSSREGEDRPPVPAARRA